MGRSVDDRLVVVCVALLVRWTPQSLPLLCLSCDEIRGCMDDGVTVVVLVVLLCDVRAQKKMLPLLMM